MNKEELEYLQRIVISSASKIAASSVYLGLFSDNWLKDPVPVLQLGLAVMMDKPIVIVGL